KGALISGACAPANCAIAMKAETQNAIGISFIGFIFFYWLCKAAELLFSHSETLQTSIGYIWVDYLGRAALRLSCTQISDVISSCPWCLDRDVDSLRDCPCGMRILTNSRVYDGLREAMRMPRA